MKFDSYPRFLKSDLYRQSLVADMEGVSLPYDEEEVGEKEFKGRSFIKKVWKSVFCCFAYHGGYCFLCTWSVSSFMAGLQSMLTYPKSFLFINFEPLKVG